MSDNQSQTNTINMDTTTTHGLTTGNLISFDGEILNGNNRTIVSVSQLGPGLVWGLVAAARKIMISSLFVTNVHQRRA